jgi:hypothetical protein
MSKLIASVAGFIVGNILAPLVAVMLPLVADWFFYNER